MRRRHFFLLFASLLALFAAGSACAAPLVPQVTQLRNGARLVTLYDPNSPLVSFDVFFRVGVNDEAGQAGITGLVTRAWFNDARWRTAAQIQRDLRGGGGAGSQFGGDFAEIWSVSGASDAEVKHSAQALFLNLIAAPGLGPEAVTRAKDSQLRILALDQDNPLERVLNRLRDRLWSSAPQGRPLLGTPDTVSAIMPPDIAAYYTRFFRPSRAVFVAAGNISPSLATRLIEANLAAADWTEEERPPAPLTHSAPDTVPPGLRDTMLSRPAPAGVLAVGYLAPGTETNTADWPALLVLDTVLGGGKSSRLFRLRDTGSLVGYEVRTLLVPSRIQSFWAAYVIGNGVPKEIRTALAGELSALASGQRPITDDELTRAKAYLKGQHAAERQRLKDRSYGIGWAEVMGLGAQFDTDFNARIDAVTLDQVTRLSRDIFGANGAVVYTQ